MRALVLDPELFLHDDYPEPASVPGESIVRVRMAGICGTDLELARGYMSYRGVPGHEFVGEVVETKTGALAGRRVVGEINAACGRCALCLMAWDAIAPTAPCSGSWDATVRSPSSSACPTKT